MLLKQSDRLIALKEGKGYWGNVLKKIAENPQVIPYIMPILPEQDRFIAQKAILTYLLFFQEKTFPAVLQSFPEKDRLKLLTAPLQLDTGISVFDPNKSIMSSLKSDLVHTILLLLPEQEGLTAFNCIFLPIVNSHYYRIVNS